MFQPELILKATPPRLSRGALERARFTGLWHQVRERTATVVIAPAGFGKTTLMLQWRRLWLERGAFVAWLTVDVQDDPARFSLALLHSLRVATGRAAFEPLAVLCATQPDREIEAMTALLAEIASLGIETVIMLDDAERLPDASARRLLAYLLHNAPANLHVLIGSRAALAVPTAELSAKGNLALLQAADLRLLQEESVEILSRRFGARIDLDHCVRLHDATEGWPIGLQLAASTLERSGDIDAAIGSLSGRHGDIQVYFLETLFARLPEPMAEFLVHVSILERLSVELCEALTHCGCAAEYLDRLMQETPFLSAAEHQDWMRLHPLARDFLLARFEKLPVEDRDVFHCRAYHWFARGERFHEAACHALAAGDLTATQAHAARSLWTLGTQGRMTEARAWLERIPQALLAEDVELRLFAAWIIAFSERNPEAQATCLAVLRDPETTPRVRVIATRVAGAAVMFADRLGPVVEMLREWPADAAEAAEPLYRLSYDNGLSMLALQAGRNAEVREHAARAPAEHASPALPLALAFSRVLAALSLLHDGDAIRCEAMLRPLLRDAERDAGRRGMVACVYAPVLASALREQGDPVGALALLADRLDVIERVGAPDIALLAYRTLADVALDQGDERRALHVLENMEAFARGRDLPRLVAHSLNERIRLHCHRARTETARELLARLEGLAPRFEEPDFHLFQAQFELQRALARAQLWIATGNLDAAQAAIGEAETLASNTGRGREGLKAMALRAVLHEMRGATSPSALLFEAMALTEIGGFRRALTDAHPAVAAMIARLVPVAPAAAAVANPVPAASLAVPGVGAGALLTPKEAHILGLLNSGMSNKGIARAMEISEQTVKWHLKNLFVKLSAPSRQHAVGRARLLGLISG
jgi:LuxR family maltose regulon positive regulatory protein